MSRAPASVDPVPEPDVTLAERLFGILAERTRDGAGVTREAYGEGEQAAHDLVAEEAREVGLRTSVDAAGNLYVTLPGSDPDPRSVIVGSHLDSVPVGGNFDGAAGVLSGLAVAVGWRRAGFQLRDDLTVMVIRAEESNWFPYSYVGSKAALGLLPPEALEIPRSDTGRSLAEHMKELGFAPDRVRAGAPQIDVAKIRAYIEPHIEQGPTLVEENQPTALVTGIRGSVRHRHARVLGEYAHSGAVPHRYRHDAVIGASVLVTRLQDEWRHLEAEGHDLVFTVGILTTDPTQHAFSKIAGEVTLSIDVRSSSEETLDLMRRRVGEIAAEVAADHAVGIELGPLTTSTSATMDRQLLDTFGAAMEELGVPRFEMACGAGHDAAVFATAGVPTLMLFVRNQNGSHNPDEAMEMADFATTTRVLARGLAAIS